MDAVRIDRMVIHPDSIPTGKTKEDAMFGRPVLLKAASGKQDSSGRWDYTETPILRDVVLDFEISTDLAYTQISYRFYRVGLRDDVTITLPPQNRAYWDMCRVRVKNYTRDRKASFTKDECEGELALI